MTNILMRRHINGERARDKKQMFVSAARLAGKGCKTFALWECNFFYSLDLVSLMRLGHNG
jgi:hypothetical protein